MSAKNCPLGFAEMPGDFINAYVLKSLGHTGPALGACATFLYNLQRGVDDIKSGRARIAVVGASGGANYFRAYGRLCGDGCTGYR